MGSDTIKVKRKDLQNAPGSLYKCFYKRPKAMVNFTLTRNEDNDGFILTSSYNWFARRVLSLLLFIPNLILIVFQEGVPGSWSGTISEFKRWWNDEAKEQFYCYDIDEHRTEVDAMRKDWIIDYWFDHGGHKLNADGVVRELKVGD